MSSVTIARVKVALNESTGPFERALQAVLILNIGDAVLTSWWVATGWATEANPLMNRVLELGIGPFLFTKALVGMFAVVILKAHQNRLISKIGLAAILIAYLGVLGVHLSHGAHRLSEGTIIASIDGDPLDFSGR
jgi:hypothetical protein